MCGTTCKWIRPATLPLSVRRLWLNLWTIPLRTTKKRSPVQHSVRLDRSVGVRVEKMGGGSVPGSEVCLELPVQRTEIHNHHRRQLPPEDHGFGTRLRGWTSRPVTDPGPAGEQCRHHDAPQSRTADWYELQLGTNHLGHFALTGILLETLGRGTGPRVVTVSSIAHTAPTLRGGLFYGPSGFQETRGAPIEVQAVAAAHDPATGRRLWSVSEQLTGVTFPLQTPTTEPPANIGDHRRPVDSHRSCRSCRQAAGIAIATAWGRHGPFRTAGRAVEVHVRVNSRRSLWWSHRAISDCSIVRWVESGEHRLRPCQCDRREAFSPDGSG